MSAEHWHVTVLEPCDDRGKRAHRTGALCISRDALAAEAGVERAVADRTVSYRICCEPCFQGGRP